jgi:hypothetical protein
LEEQQEVVRGNKAKCKSVCRKRCCVVAVGTGTACPGTGYLKAGEKALGYIPQLKLPRKLEGKTICCDSQRAITIAGDKKKNQKNGSDSKSPIQQLWRKCLQGLKDWSFESKDDNRNNRQVSPEDSS